MKRFIVNGGKKLNGTVPVSGMKNAALPIIYACLAVNGVCTIENLPVVDDVTVSFEILKHVGVKITMQSPTCAVIDATNVSLATIPPELCSKIRASYYLLGAELSRFSHAHVGYPGGCNFCTRPIDLHEKAFRALGATVTETEDPASVQVDADNGLTANNIYFDTTSVGATVNAIIASVYAKGTTIINNAAREPHIVDLANFLNTCGAHISGAGTDTIKVKGVPANSLHGCTYAIIPDMIEAGTFMAAVACTGGDVTITNVIPKHLECVTARLLEMGIEVIEDDTSVRVISDGNYSGIHIKTQPYPGFPTDMQPQFCALMCYAQGQSVIHEAVWAQRFKYIDELRRMGAKIEVNDKIATITGCKSMHGASVRSVDLRAGAAMIIAGLRAKGATEIEDVHLIERGYEDIVGKLSSIGATIITLESKSFIG